MTTNLKIETMTAKLMPNGIYKVAYDGHVLGDDRGFTSERLCNQEIRKRLEKDQRDAMIYNRPLLYTADPKINDLF